MAVNLGEAYVDIVPSTGNLASKIRGDFDPIFDSIGKNAGRSIGRDLGASILSSLDSLGGAITGRLVQIGKVGFAALSGVAGVSLWRGLGRALDTEDATVQLRRMGLEIAEVDRLLGAVDDTFAGTPFANPDGFNISSQLYASSVALDEIPGILGTIADWSAHGGGGLDWIASIFTRIASQGKVTGEELNRLTDAGIPLATLADSMGITTEELRAMASAGRLTSDEFFNAAANVEMFQGAAKAAGDTTRGAWSNVWTALATASQKFLDPFLGENGHAVTALKSVREAIRGTYGDIGEAGEVFAGWVIPRIESGVETLVAAFGKLQDAGNRVLDFYRENQEAIDKIVAAIVPAAAGLAGLATSIHLVRTAFVLLQAATPLGLLLLLASGLVYAWQNSETFRNIVTGAFETVRDTISSVYDSVSGWLTDLFDSERGAKAGESVQLILDWFGRLGDWFEANWPTILQGIKDFGTWLSENVGPVISSVLGLGIAMFNAFVKQVDQALTFITKLWSDHGDTIMGIVEPIWEGIKQIIESALAIVSGIIRTVTAIIEGDWGAAWDEIKGIVSAAWDAIKAMFVMVGAVLWALMRNVWTLVKNAVIDGVEWAAEESAKLPGRIVRAVGNLSMLLWNAGRDVVWGLINGIESMGTTLAGRVTSFIGKFVPGTVKESLGSNSPSKVFMAIGRDVVAGLEIGITGESPTVRLAATDLAAQITAPFAGIETGVPSVDQRSYGHGVNIENIEVRDRPMWQEISELAVLQGALV